jgi:hypothetical protein
MHHHIYPRKYRDHSSCLESWKRKRGEKHRQKDGWWNRGYPGIIVSMKSSERDQIKSENLFFFLWKFSNFITSFLSKVMFFWCVYFSFWL